MPRHGIPSRTSILLLDDFSETFESHLATTDLDKRTHYGTNHVAKETVGLDGEHPFVFAELRPFSMHNTAIIGLHIGVELAETRKIGVVEQGFCRTVHGLEVQRFSDNPAHELAVEGCMNQALDLLYLQEIDPERYQSDKYTVFVATHDKVMKTVFETVHDETRYDCFSIDSYFEYLCDTLSDKKREKYTQILKELCKNHADESSLE